MAGEDLGRGWPCGDQAGVREVDGERGRGENARECWQGWGRARGDAGGWGALGGGRGAVGGA